MDITGHELSFVLERYSNPAGDIYNYAPIKSGQRNAFQYYHRLQEIKRFIEEHYMEEISLKKAARIAGLEKKYFSTFFHRKVGVGFKHWLTHLRIAEPWT